MLLRLCIIAIVIVGILVALSPEINDHYPNAVTAGLEPLRNTLSSTADQSLETAKGTIDPDGKIKSQLSETGSNTLESAGETISSAETQLHSTVDTLEEELTDIKDSGTGFVEEKLAGIANAVGISESGT